MAGVRVTAAARLHLGFLDLNGGLGRRFGSIGLAVDKPATRLKIFRAPVFEARGPESERALVFLRRYAEALGLGEHYGVEIAEAIPAHAGLGSGTQLALAIGSGLIALEGVDRQPRDLGELVARGARSAIGMMAFSQGGFIIDGGKGARAEAPPVLVRTDFPNNWRVLLVVNQSAEGTHGDRETEAFAALPAFSGEAAAHICRLVLMRLLPGLYERDIDAFGAALTEIQEIVGGHFSTVQGGSPWSSPAVGRIVNRLGAEGAVGLGQSSWGPTGFAFVSSEDVARRAFHSVAEEAKAEGLEILLARGRNDGARLEPTDNEQPRGA
jgi:beta-RFAP synthase